MHLNNLKYIVNVETMSLQFQAWSQVSKYDRIVYSPAAANKIIKLS